MDLPLLKNVLLGLDAGVAIQQAILDPDNLFGFLLWIVGVEALDLQGRQWLAAMFGRSNALLPFM